MGDNAVGFGIGSFISWLVLGAVAMALYGCPRWSVWQQGLSGEAELKRAEWNRQIAIQEANARREAAKALAEADTIRAHGVAASNAIIGKSLKDNEGYLRYLWIQNLHEGKPQVIYVPTEANLPILEAGKR